MTEGACFPLTSGINVAIQNPLLDMKTGTMLKDMLISIAKHAEEE